MVPLHCFVSLQWPSQHMWALCVCCTDLVVLGQPVGAEVGHELDDLAGVVLLDHEEVALLLSAHVRHLAAVDAVRVRHDPARTSLQASQHTTNFFGQARGAISRGREVGQPVVGPSAILS